MLDTPENRGDQNADLPVLLEDDAWRFGRMDLRLRLVAPAGGPAWPVDQP